VDWGTPWAPIGPQPVRLQGLVRGLGYARRLYVEFPHAQPLATLIACHAHAFDWWGGLTEELRDDHPNTVVRKRDREGRGIAWHPQLWDVARDSGVMPRWCRPYRAPPTGKVESGGKDRQAPLRPRAPVAPRGGLEPDGGGVGGRGADQRLHGTTFCQPAAAVARDGLVTVETNR
jgi:transposase